VAGLALPWATQGRPYIQKHRQEGGRRGGFGGRSFVNIEISYLLMPLWAVLLVIQLRVFTRASQLDRSWKFIRASYIWLLVAIGMMPLLIPYSDWSNEPILIAKGPVRSTWGESGTTPRQPPGRPGQRPQPSRRQQ